MKATDRPRTDRARAARGLLSREAFTQACFARSRGRCCACIAQAVDAHHILERALWPDGGYYLDNSAALCAACHWKAECGELGPNALRAACAIASPLLPPGWDPQGEYDKWGNQELGGAQKRLGPLGWHEGMLKAWARAGWAPDSQQAQDFRLIRARPIAP